MKDQSPKPAEIDKSIEDDKEKIKRLERVIKEVKKQILCYKEEITSIKKMENYITMENYQKLVNDFNSLYDHYKVAK
jgi:hypothetical protein